MRSSIDQPHWAKYWYWPAVGGGSCEGWGSWRYHYCSLRSAIFCTSSTSTSLVLTGLYSQLDFASSLTSRWYCHKTEWWTDTAIHSISLKAKKEITPKKTGIYNRDWLSRLSTINLLNNMCWMYRNNKYLLCFLLRTVKKMHKYDIADCWFYSLQTHRCWRRLGSSVLSPGPWLRFTRSLCLLALIQIL